MYKEIVIDCSVIHSQRFTGRTEGNYGNLNLTGRGMNLELPEQDVSAMKLCNNAFLIAYLMPFIDYFINVGFNDFFTASEYKVSDYWIMGQK
jgi:hypothetical protein